MEVRDGENEGSDYEKRAGHGMNSDTVLSAPLALRVKIKRREDGKAGWIGWATYRGATVLATGATDLEVADSLVERLSELMRGAHG